MQMHSLFRIVAMTSDEQIKRKVVNHLNAMLRPKRRKLPFTIWFSEASTKDKLIFRVEHQSGTSNTVVVTKREDNHRWKMLRYSLVLDASNGSNWHHLKSYFVEWMRDALTLEAPESLVDMITLETV
jgi:hypothetical protein